MKKSLIPIGLLVVFFSCQPPKPQMKLGTYFALDSLLNSQVALLSHEGVTVQKTVTMDGKSETKTQTLDTAGWKDEFTIIRDFDINKPHYVGAYKNKSVDGNDVYQKEKGTKAPVSELVINKSEGNLVGLSATYFEDKTIYQHKRNLEMTFKGDMLKSYRISGFQKMVMKDTIFYTISGEVE